MRGSNSTYWLIPRAGQIGFERAQRAAEFGRGPGEEGVEFLARDAERGELLRGHIGFFALDLVDDLQELGRAFGGHLAGGEKIQPDVPVVDADEEIVLRQAERAEKVDGQRDHLRVGGGGGFADEVAVELGELAQPPLLLFLVAEETGDGKPLDRFAEIPVPRGDHARHGGGHLGAQRDLALALVDEVEKLSDEFAAALFAVQLDGFERRAIHLDETVAPGGRAPGVENVGARGGVSRVKIAETGEGLHGRKDEG